jgi:hypothetical protein
VLLNKPKKKRMKTRFASCLEHQLFEGSVGITQNRTCEFSFILSLFLMAKINIFMYNEKIAIQIKEPTKRRKIRMCTRNI